MYRLWILLLSSTVVAVLGWSPKLTSLSPLSASFTPLKDFETFRGLLIISSTSQLSRAKRMFHYLALIHHSRKCVECNKQPTVELGEFRRGEMASGIAIALRDYADDAEFMRDHNLGDDDKEEIILELLDNNEGVTHSYSGPNTAATLNLWLKNDLKLPSSAAKKSPAMTANSLLVELDDSNHDSYVLDHPQVFVLLRSLQCDSSCRKASVEMERAALYAKRRGIGARFASLNKSKTTERIGVAAGIVFWSQGVMHEYTGPLTSDSLIKFYFFATKSTLLKNVSPGDLFRFAAAHENSVVAVVLTASKGKKKTFLKTVDKIANEVIFLPITKAEATSDEEKTKLGLNSEFAIVAFRDFGKIHSVLDATDDVTQERMRHFVLRSTMPSVAEPSLENMDRLMWEKSDRDLLLVILDASKMSKEDFEAARKQLDELASKLVEMVQVALVNVAENELSGYWVRWLALDKNDLPTFRLRRNREEVTKYRPEHDRSLDPKAMEEFILECKERKRRPYLKSGNLSVEANEGSIKTLVATNFMKETVDKTVFLMLHHGKKCKKCDAIEKVWISLVTEKQQQLGMLTFAKMDLQENEAPGLEDFLGDNPLPRNPYLLLFVSGFPEPIPFDGDAETSEKFAEFLAYYGNMKPAETTAGPTAVPKAVEAAEEAAVATKAADAALANKDEL